jgi:hypothetical protein
MTAPAVAASRTVEQFKNAENAAPASIPAAAAATEAPAQPADGPVRPTRLRIEFNADAGRFVLLDIDPDSKKVVQQIPTEAALRRITWFREVIDGQKADRQA